MPIVVFDDLKPFPQNSFYAVLTEGGSNDIFTPKNRAIARPEVDFKAFLILEMIALKVKAAAPAKARGRCGVWIIHEFSIFTLSVRRLISAAGQYVHADH